MKPHSLSDGAEAFMSRVNKTSCPCSGPTGLEDPNVRQHLPSEPCPDSVMLSCPISYLIPQGLPFKGPSGGWEEGTPRIRTLRRLRTLGPCVSVEIFCPQGLSGSFGYIAGVWLSEERGWASFLTLGLDCRRPGKEGAPVLLESLTTLVPAALWLQ